jgi:hypothetical protein
MRQCAAFFVAAFNPCMEPDLPLDHGLESVLHELQQFEPLIYAANDGQPRAYFERLLAPEFWEVGASGKRYDRAFVLDALENRYAQPIDEAWEISAPHVQAIAEGVYLFTYNLHQPTRVSRRATLWRRTETGWKMVYHQGTVVAA